MPDITAIADAVVELLNDSQGSGAPLSQTFEAIRVPVPQTDFTGVTSTTLQVRVVPIASIRERNDRATVREDDEINIVYMLKISQAVDPTAAAGNDVIDPLVEFGRELCALLDGTSSAGRQLLDGAAVVRTERDPIFDFAVLQTHRVFVARVRVFVFHT
jgi:hypothetical protein